MRLLDITATGSLGLTFLIMPLMVGCYEETDPGRSQGTGEYDEAGYDDPGSGAEQVDATEPSADEPARPYGNSGSTLGRAKDSAKRTVGDLEARDKDLQKQIDDQ